MSSELTQIDEVLHKTIEAIEEGKHEIFEISEKTRSDVLTLEEELIAIQQQIVALIEEVDLLEFKEKASRQRLVQVSKDFKSFSENEIKKAYDTAKDLQVKLSIKRHEEAELKKSRSKLEMRIKDAREVLKRAENLTTKVGMALDYLTGSIHEKMEDIKERQSLGIRIIAAQEEERRRVSREIHDGPAQVLSNVVLKTEYCEKLLDIDTEKTRAELRLLREIVRNSLKDIRRIIYNLMPMSLEDLGLIPTVQKFLDDVKQDYQIEVKLTVHNKDDMQLDRVVKLAVFRIIQEGVHNICKHAQATRAVVELSILTTQIDIRIHDNGIGINHKQVEKEQDEMSGFGLYGIKERVKLLEGDFDIQPLSDKGTRLDITIPLK